MSLSSRVTELLELKLGTGTAILGQVSIDQTTANANKVVTKTGSLTALEAGTAIVGKVGIDQTTNETTNKVMTQGIAMSKAKTTAVAASLVVKAAAGTLYGLLIYNTGAVDQYVQVHNAASLPADAAVPDVVIPVYAGSTAFLEFGVYGIPFTTGIVVSNSTTVATKTIGAADCWFVATYK